MSTANENKDLAVITYGLDMEMAEVHKAIRSAGCIISPEVETAIRSWGASQGFSSSKISNLIMASRAYASQCAIEQEIEDESGEDAEVVEGTADEDGNVIEVGSASSSDVIAHYAEVNGMLNEFLGGSSTSFVYHCITLLNCFRLVGAVIVQLSLIPINMAYFGSFIAQSPLAQAITTAIKAGTPILKAASPFAVAKYLATSKGSVGIKYSAQYWWSAMKLAIVLFFFTRPLKILLKPKHEYIVAAMNYEIDAIVECGLRDVVDGGTRRRPTEEEVRTLKRKARQMLGNLYEGLYD